MVPALIEDRTAFIIRMVLHSTADMSPTPLMALHDRRKTDP
jgi:hypothetical protein